MASLWDIIGQPNYDPFVGGGVPPQVLSNQGQPTGIFPGLRPQGTAASNIDMQTIAAMAQAARDNGVQVPQNRLAAIASQGPDEIKNFIDNPGDYVSPPPKISRAGGSKGVVPAGSGTFDSLPNPDDTTDLGPYTPPGVGSVVPGASTSPMTPDQLNDYINRTVDKSNNAAELQKTLDNIPLQKPEFDPTYGKVNPYLSILKSGLSTLANGTGKAPLAAIGAGGAEGLADFEKQVATAQQQRKEMRQENRQYSMDLANRAKMVFDAKTGDQRLDAQNKQLAIQAYTAAQTGKYQDASIAIQRAHLNITYANSARGMLTSAMQLQQSNDPRDQKLGKMLEQASSWHTLGADATLYTNIMRALQNSSLAADPQKLAEVALSVRNAFQAAQQMGAMGGSPGAVPGTP